MIRFPFKIWKHAFSAPCIRSFYELIWKFPINDMKICHELEPKYLTANPLLKSESPRWTDFCSITGTLPRCFFVSFIIFILYIFLRVMMSQRKYINSCFWVLLMIAATLFPWGWGQHTRHASFLLLAFWLHPPLPSAHWFVASMPWFELSQM